MTTLYSYSHKTKDVRITLISMFMKEESNPEEDMFTWSYMVTIENLREEAIKILNKRWMIVDSSGHFSCERDKDFISEDIVIDSQKSFEYAQSVCLSAPSGIISTLYNMVSVPSQEEFVVDAPPLSLDSPYEVMMLN